MTTVSDPGQLPRARLPITVHRALSAAVERVAERHLPPAGIGQDEIRADLRRICESVVAIAADGRVPRAATGARPLDRALIDAFRTEFVAHLAERPHGRISARDLITVFAALDAIARQRGMAVTPPTFGSELAQSEVLQGMREIAHDMRSPLAAILLLVEPIRKGQKGPVTPVQERQLGLIFGAALSLSALTDDVLDAGRLQQPYVRVERPFAVSGIIEGACAVVRPIAEEKGLELRSSYPQRDGRIGDAAAIQRVLLNLITNALKYTDEGFVAVGCTERDGDRLEFWVEDSGVGIPDHALRVLRDHFHVGPDNFRFSSSGLGLAICRSLLERLGGSLAVEPRDGGGTRFSFTLELAIAPGSDS